MTTVVALALGGTSLLVACDDGTAVVDAGIDLDANDAPIDAGDVEDDAGEGDASGEAADASGEEADAGDVEVDSGVDAGPPDGDMDGVPTAVDCDDADPLVGAESSRSCSTACGEGVELCTDGAWAACDAPTACLCTTPGATRIVPCARCGTQGERCGDAGVWETTSACLGQGACEPGEVDNSYTAYCTHHSQRLCGATCGWGSWMVAGTGLPRGECEGEGWDGVLCAGGGDAFGMCTEDCRWRDGVRPCPAP